jgi:hypothetical protein
MGADTEQEAGIQWLSLLGADGSRQKDGRNEAREAEPLSAARDV